MHVVLIEHDEANRLYPFALTHAAWELRSGYYRIADRWRAALPGCRVHVYTERTEVQSVYQARHTGIDSAYDNGPTLVMLANVVISPSVMRQVVDFCTNSKGPLHILIDGQTVGVFLTDHQGGLAEIASSIDAVDGSSIEHVQVAGHIINRLWQMLDRIRDCVQWDAELLGAHVADSAVIHPSVVIDESEGPVIIGHRAQIGAFSLVQGPSVIGDDCIVKPHSHIRSSVFGEHCRVSGEISDSVFQSYSNKQHSGFVGHSYIGSWVNLGAGTTTSNLKNTYSHVRPTLPWGREDSQRMFLGSLIGDHTRTAIGAMLPSGSVYGVCSAVFQTSPAPSYMPSFSWDENPYEFNKAMITARTVMSRRNLELSQAEEHLLRRISESIHGNA